MQGTAGVARPRAASQLNGKRPYLQLLAFERSTHRGGAVEPEAADRGRSMALRAVCAVGLGEEPRSNQRAGSWSPVIPMKWGPSDPAGDIPQFEIAHFTSRFAAEAFRCPFLGEMTAIVVHQCIAAPAMAGRPRPAPSVAHPFGEKFLKPVWNQLGEKVLHVENRDEERWVGLSAHYG